MIEKSKFILRLDTSHHEIEGADAAAYIANHLRAVAAQVEAKPEWLGMFQDIKAPGYCPDYPAGQFANKPQWYLDANGG